MSHHFSTALYQQNHKKNVLNSHFRIEEFVSSVSVPNPSFLFDSILEFLVEAYRQQDYHEKLSFEHFFNHPVYNPVPDVSEQDFRAILDFLSLKGFIFDINDFRIQEIFTPAPMSLPINLLVLEISWHDTIFPVEELSL